MTPAPGAVAWWSSNHVAWVKSVNNNGTVTIEEYNVPAGSGNYNERTIAVGAVSGYIHFKDIQPPPPPPRSVVVIDDNGGAALFGPTRWWHTSGIGYAGLMHWTWNESTSMYNHARWTPNLAGGKYEVYAWIPRNYATTTSAQYMITAKNICGLRWVNQNAYYDQWVSLGTYEFLPGTSGYVELTDRTGERRGTRMIGFDAMKFVPR